MLKFFKIISLPTVFAIFILLSLACASTEVEGYTESNCITDYPNDDVLVSVTSDFYPGEWGGNPELSGKITSLTITVTNKTNNRIKVIFDEANINGQVPFLEGTMPYTSRGITPPPILTPAGYESTFEMTSSMQWYLDSWIYNGQTHSRWTSRPLSKVVVATLPIEIEGKMYYWTISSIFKESKADSNATESETKKAQSDSE